MYIFCTFIIIQNFDFSNFCIENIYKFSALYNFCIHIVQSLYKYFAKGTQLKLEICWLSMVVSIKPVD